MPVDGRDLAPHLPKMESLILTEAYAGLQNQALGLAERAGFFPEIRVLKPRGRWAALPARWWPDPVATVAPAAAGPLPPLLFGCGGVAAAVNARLRRDNGSFIVHVQHPRLDPKAFDLIVVQAHDNLIGPNIVVTRTALHRVTRATLDEARKRWWPVFSELPRPLVSVLVGGSNGRFRLDRHVGTALAAQLADMMRVDSVGLALTPSRRTAPEVIAALRSALAPLGGWIWDGTGENPYFGLLACADIIIVTGDSVSMISEAAATDVPVLVAPLPGRSRRIAAFTASLLAERRIRLYAGRCESWPCAALDDTDMAVEALRARLC